MIPLIPALLFWVDLLVYQLWEAPILCTIVACYTVLLLRPTTSYPALIIALLLNGLESFVVFGRFGANYIILLPLTLIALAIRHHITTNMYTHILLGTLVALCQAYALPILLRY